jgi:hypothetical protein
VSDDLREAIRREAARLDVVRPGWAAEIDRKRLDMTSSTDCIYGQLFGNYRDLMRSIRRLEPRRAARIDAACDLMWGQVRRYRDLWLDEIDVRTGEPG